MMNICFKKAFGIKTFEFKMKSDATNLTNQNIFVCLEIN